MTFPATTVDATIINVFGQDVTYTPDGGSPIVIKAYFQSPDVSPESGELEILMQGPRVHCKTVDVPSPSQLDQFIVDGVTYQVSDIQKDEGALVQLHLEKV